MNKIIKTILIIITAIITLSATNFLKHIFILYKPSYFIISILYTLTLMLIHIILEDIAIVRQNKRIENMQNEIKLLKIKVSIMSETIDLMKKTEVKNGVFKRSNDNGF